MPNSERFKEAEEFLKSVFIEPESPVYKPSTKLDLDDIARFAIGSGLASEYPESPGEGEALVGGWNPDNWETE